MQKLIWKNGNGKEIELTKEPYGITEWDGFSSTELNVQTQQVPFNDGAVFIDALLEQRSLSVTLAMNDKNNLEDRYRLRRELIASMNPKLGEGFLIYENDFLKKQIKCLPYIPTFENHNSNTKGTPKVQLSWVACEPYWEDVEETSIFLKQGSLVNIENKGDVPCTIKARFTACDSENTTIKNITQDKKIKIQNTLDCVVDINTGTGEKTIKKEVLDFDVSLFVANDFTDICESKKLGKVFLVSADCLYYSENGKTWNFLKFSEGNQRFNHICYSDDLNMLVVSCVNSNVLYTTTDFENWNTVTLDTDATVDCIIYGGGKFMAVGSKLFISTDGVEWVSQNKTGDKIIYNPLIEKYLITDSSSIYISTNSSGLTWQTVSYKLTDVIFGAGAYNCFIGIHDGKLVTSTNGSQWTQLSDETIRGILALNEFSNVLVCVDNTLKEIKTIDVYGDITEQDLDFEAGVRKIIYAGSLFKFITVGDYGYITTSEDGVEFEKGSFIYEYGQYTPVFSSMAYKKVGNRIAIHGSSLYKNRTYLAFLSEDGTLDREIYSNEYNGIDVGDIACNADGSVIVTTKGFVKTNGVWTLQTPNVEMQAIEYDAHSGKYIGIKSISAYVNEIYTSTDGLNWSKVYDLNGYSIPYNLSNGVKWIAISTNGIICITIQPQNDYPNILRSVNTEDWEIITQGLYVGSRIGGIIYDSFRSLFIFNALGVTFTSVTGSSWSHNPNDNRYYVCIFLSETKKLIALSADEKVYQSNDGYTFSETTEKYPVLTSSAWAIGKTNIYLTGRAFFKSYTQSEENIIDKLSSDSDMGLSLDTGNNTISISADSGSVECEISYRQKYIGV